MPQDGSNNYYYPPSTPGVSDTPIKSNDYNAFIDDLKINDLNIPRPIHRGGTGAVNAHDAMVNLSGEISGQQVTNYDSHPFVSGSFTSDVGATAAPEAAGFDGIAYLHATNPAYGFIEARSLATGFLYLRNKAAGAWGAWQLQPSSSADLDARYVNVTGDTMSGALTVTPKGSTFGGPTGTLATGVVTQADANIMLYNGTGSNWAGIGADTSGNMWFRTGTSGSPTPAFYIDTAQNSKFTGNVTIGSAGASGAYYFGNTATKYLTYDGSKFVLNGGELSVNSDVRVNRGGSPGSGAYYFGPTGTIYLYYDGSNFTLNGGSLNIGAALTTSTLICTGSTYTGTAGATGTYYFGNTGTKYLTYDGTNFTLNGGAFVANAFQSTVNSGYNYICNFSGVRSWGIFAAATGQLGFDDISGGARVATLTYWNGSYATMILPYIGTSAVSPNWAISTVSGAFIFTSSRRYKKDIEPLTQADADKVLLLDAVTYKSTSEVDDPDRVWYGFVAEDVDLVDSRLVYREYKREDMIDEPQGEGRAPIRKPRDGAIKVPDQVDYTRITVLAVAKVQEQQKRIQAQEDRIAELISRIEALEATP